MTAREYDNIVLIGMPGVGKSTAGVIAAKQLGMRFEDADILIQHREKKLLSQIIDEKGIDGFLSIENDVLKSIKDKGLLIATGGSAVYSCEAMEYLKKNSLMIYLHLNLKDLSMRLSDLRHRGVVLRDGQTLNDIYVERVPLYRKYADVEIDETGLDIEETVTLICERVSTHNYSQNTDLTNS
ncbi:MAG: shikimate kinase [Lachnospiraceae bacterium]|nr:shikimate kinase [Lachnospiraceae bacterium]